MSTIDPVELVLFSLWVGGSLAWFITYKVSRHPEYNGLLAGWLRTLPVRLTTGVAAVAAFILLSGWELHKEGVLVPSLLFYGGLVLVLCAVGAVCIVAIKAWEWLIEGKQPTEPTPTISTEIPPADRKSWMD